jgi:tetratricopeptide (TPR) repeat protein
MSLFKKSFFVFALFFLPLSTVAQNNDYHLRLQGGIRLINADQYSQATSLFKKMRKDFPDSLRVQHYLGLIQFKLENWGNAKDYYKEIVDKNEDDIEARYYLGICYRELGKFQAIGLRNLTWRKANIHLRYVYTANFRYKDIYYQYALLKRFQEDYPAAIHYLRADERMSQSVKAVEALHRTYESFLFNKRNDLLNWTPDKPDSTLLLYKADAYRQNGELDKAAELYSQLLAAPPASLSPVPLNISVAKQQYQLEKEDSCQYYYERAIDLIKTQADASLMFQDMKYIFSDDELKQYEQLDRVEEKRSYLKKMWISRNPMPAKVQNYRIVEHVRRVILAEKEFYYDGIRSQVNNPDKLNYLNFPLVFQLNEKFNDKGLVYIRHGEPDDRGFFVQADVPLNETWVYHPRGQLGQKLMFHFWQDNDMGADNWRLVPSIPPYMAESRLHMDPIFGQMMVATELEALSLEQQMKMQSQRVVRLGMDTDQHSWDRELRSIFFPFYIATFKKDEKSSQCELYYSLMTNDVLYKKAPHTIDDSVSINFAVYDPDFNLLQREEARVPIRRIVDASEKMGFWPSKFEFITDPGTYQLALDVRTPGDEAIGGYKFRFNATSYMSENISMSGLVLAKSITEGQPDALFYRNGFNIIPNPGKLFTRKEPVNIYFEIYNLPAQNDKNVNFLINYNVRLLEERTKGLINKIGRIFQKAQPSISNQVERVSTTSTSIEYIALDLEKNVPGVYELKVSAFVPGEQDTTSRQIKFELE